MPLILVGFSEFGDASILAKRSRRNVEVKSLDGGSRG